MKYKRIFRMLVNAGHSGFAAGQILDNAVRGNAHDRRFARQWIGTIYRTS